MGGQARRRKNRGLMVQNPRARIGLFFPALETQLWSRTSWECFLPSHRSLGKASLCQSGRAGWATSPWASIFCSDFFWCMEKNRGQVMPVLRSISARACASPPARAALAMLGSTLPRSSNTPTKGIHLHHCPACWSTTCEKGKNPNGKTNFLAHPPTVGVGAGTE